MTCENWPSVQKWKANFMVHPQIWVYWYTKSIN